MPLTSQQLDAALAYADSHMNASLERLTALIAIKSISTDPAYAAECKRAADWLVAVVNWTPITRTGYRVGVPEAGEYDELLNSDAAAYGGGNVGNLGTVASEDVAAHGRPHSLRLTLPPLGAVILKLRSSNFEVRK